RGTGAREVFGLLGIAVEAEKEVVSIVVAEEYQELVARAIFHAGGLGNPGGGYLYITPLEKLATFIPRDTLARLQDRD
ncbi:MAG TPA: P-II family nitrogen regulator, partial [Thioalkalivibrio sp.]|nr:P-II family nitrogen regulator [Thioalkalivibrio sp.]